MWNVAIVCCLSACQFYSSSWDWIAFSVLFLLQNFLFFSCDWWWQKSAMNKYLIILHFCQRNHGDINYQRITSSFCSDNIILSKASLIKSSLYLKKVILSNLLMRFLAINIKLFGVLLQNKNKNLAYQQEVFVFILVTTRRFLLLFEWFNFIHFDLTIFFSSWKNSC